MDWNTAFWFFIISSSLFNVICSEDPSIHRPRFNPHIKPQMSKVNWLCEISGAPEVVWFNNNGERVTNGSKYSMKLKSNKHQLIFLINNATVSDNGIYRIEATKGNWSQVIEVPVTIEDKTRIELPPYTYYKPGSHASVKMTVTGLPFPESIDCKVFSCSDSTCEGQPVELSATKITEWKKTYTVNLEPVRNATLVCTADYLYNGKKQQSKNETMLIPTNAAELDVVDVVEKIVSDDVELICDVPLTYGPNLTWYNPIGNKIDDTYTRYEIKTANTEISHQSFLTIKSIEWTDSGAYTCQAVLLVDQSLHQKLFNVSVHGAQKPVIIKSNLNNSLVEIFARDALNMYCVVSGRPQPKLHWMKDSQPWTPDSMDVERTVTHKENSLKVVESTLFIEHLKLDDSGQYSCRASNDYGYDERFINLDVKSVTSAVPYILIIIAIVLVFMIATTYLVWKVMRERKKRKLLEEAGLGELFYSGDPNQYDPNNLLQDQPNVLPYDKKWEFPRDKLKLLSRLGEGAFGEVWKAQARGITDAENTSDVAVKMLKKYANADEMIALVSELKILMHLGKHLNVVNLLGACTNNRRQCELLVIEEYCEFGNIENYMKKHRDVFIDLLKDNRRTKGNVNNGYSTSTDKSSAYVDVNTSLPVTGDTISGSRTTNKTPYINVSDLVPSGSPCEWRSNSLYSGGGGGGVGGRGEEAKRPLTTRDLLCWAFQVTRGMAHLHSKHIIHRDLAARNILLAADNVVKICDFGLSRNIYKCGNYKKQSEGKLPWKWMALECLTEMKFTEHSDVWSFGIVMWEMFSLALTPYPGFQADEYFCRRLRDGYRLELPEYADDQLHRVMLDCWDGDPHSRPSFPQLEKMLATFMDQEDRAHYVDLNSVYMEMNRSSSPAEDYLPIMSPEMGGMNTGTEVSDDDTSSDTKPDGIIAMSSSKDQVHYVNTEKLPTDGAMSNVQQNDSYFLANENERHNEEITPMLSEKIVQHVK